MIHPPELLDRIRELGEQGRTGGEIAAEVGMTRNAVIGICHRRGFKFGRKVLTGEWTAPAKVKRVRGKRQRPSRPVLIAAPIAPVREVRSLATTPLPRLPDLPFTPPPHGGVGFMALASNACRFGLWDYRQRVPLEAKRFCGAETATGSSWCPAHRALVYARAKPEAA